MTTKEAETLLKQAKVYGKYIDELIKAGEKQLAEAKEREYNNLTLAVNALTPEEVLVIRQYFFRGKTLISIAIDVGMSYPTIYRRKASGIKTIAEMLSRCKESHL